MLFSASVENATNKHIEQTSYTLSDDERQSQQSQRLDLIEYLFERGLNSSTAENNAPYGFLSDIVITNSPEPLQALVSKGFSMASAQDNEDAERYTALSKARYAMVDPLLQLGHQWGTLKKKHPSGCGPIRTGRKSMQRTFPKWNQSNVSAIAVAPMAPNPSKRSGNPDGHWNWRESPYCSPRQILKG